MEHFSVLLESSSFHPEYLSFSHPYVYWHKPSKQKCFNIDSILSLQFENSSLSILTMYKSDLKLHFFQLKSDGKPLVSALKSILFPTSRRFLIIYNKSSGPGRSSEVLRKILLPVLSHTPYPFKVTNTKEDYLSKLDSSITDLVFLGGDGTVQMVLTEIYKKNPRLLDSVNIGVLPTGSRNALAVELTGKDIMTAVFCIIKNKVLLGDLVKVQLDSQELISTCAVIWGLGADIPKEADSLRGLGPIRFPIVILRKLMRKWKTYQASFEFTDLNGKKNTKTSDFNMISLGNHQAKNIANDEIPFPYASIQSGCIDGLVIENCGKIDSLKLFWQSMNSGEHANNSKAQFFKFKNCEIRSENLNNVAIDGEVYVSRVVKLEVLPQIIRFLGLTSV